MNQHTVRATTAPSASGARIGGDDLQHLVAWYWCLVSQNRHRRIASVAIEADHAGNVDDVVVRIDGGPDIYHQIKASVSGTGLAGSDWLMTPSPSGGPSILQKLYTSWSELDHSSASISLITSRPIDPTDPILKLLDRRNLLGPNLRRANSGSKVAKGRKAWADHVHSSEEELCAFLDVLQFHLGQTEAEWRSKVTDVAMGAGVRFDEMALSVALGEVRNWVKTTRTERSPSQIADVIKRLELRAELPRAVVAVQAIDVEPGLEDAAAALDWIHLFRGNSPRSRRGLINAKGWRDQLPHDLQGVVAGLRSNGAHRVLVRGKMRLPTWFAVGTHLSDVAGFEVAAADRGELWIAESGDGSAAVFRILHEERVGAGNEALLIVSISMDATSDAHKVLAANNAIGRLVTVTIDGGPDRRLIKNGPHAMACAVAIRDFARSLSRETPRVHLVLSCPGPFALFLGHLWDRIVPTQLYEDLVVDYEPAFEIRN